MSQRFNFPREQVFSDLGAIGAGYKLYTYETGTTTPLATYSDTNLSVANANPTIADSTGRFGDIFIDDAKLYKAILKDADDNTIYTADPVDPKIFKISDFDPKPTSFWGTTAGTASAYTLDSNVDINAYSSNDTFFFSCHLDCNDSPTMIIDDLTALNLKKYDGAGAKIALEANDILSSQRYEATNDGTDIIILNPEKPTLIKTSSGGELTIATGEITVTNTRHTIDTESDASSDDLDTINGGIGGQLLTLSIADDARDVVIKSGTGNIVNPSSLDITLTSTDQRAHFEYDGTNWIFLNIKLPGDVVQVQNTLYSTRTSTTSVIAIDNSIPQSSEGLQVFTQAITPKDSNNKLIIDVITNVCNDGATRYITTALFQDSTSSAIASTTLPAVNNGASINSTLKHYMTAGTTSSTTFKVRFGTNAGTAYINGNSSTALFGGTMYSSITIMEIQT